jgi:hypothetical protein
MRDLCVRQELVCDKRCDNVCEGAGMSGHGLGVREDGKTWV